MINEVNQFCKNYYDSIPAHSLKAIGLSAIGSFTVAILLFQKPDQATDFSRPAICAGITVVAASIHALTAPLFAFVFDNTGTYNPYQDIFQTICSIAFTEILINHSVSYKVNLLSSKFCSHVVLPSALFKAAAAIALCELANQTFADNAQQNVKKLGVDFNQNTTPVFFVI